eukprot:6031510-Pyramimonas_sp.AAC.1
MGPGARVEEEAREEEGVGEVKTGFLRDIHWAPNIRRRSKLADDRMEPSLWANSGPIDPNSSSCVPKCGYVRTACSVNVPSRSDCISNRP